MRMSKVSKEDQPPMTPQRAIEIAGGRAFLFSGRWPKLNVYDQADQSRKIIIDPNICAGCAVANVYQSMTGRIGDYARMLYEGAKQRRKGHKDERGGITLKEVCKYATDKYGGDYHRLNTVEEILSWIAVVGPVAAGFKWRSGMEYPRGKGNWFRSLFGARWAMRRGPVMGYHAVSILGVSNKKGGYVVIENSRGLNHGNKGTSRLSWDDLEKTLEEGELFAYGVDFEEAREIYETN